MAATTVNLTCGELAAIPVVIAVLLPVAVAMHLPVSPPDSFHTQLSLHTVLSLILHEYQRMSEDFDPDQILL